MIGVSSSQCQKSQGDRDTDVPRYIDLCIGIRTYHMQHGDLRFDFESSFRGAIGPWVASQFESEKVQLGKTRGLPSPPAKSLLRADVSARLARQPTIWKAGWTSRLEGDRPCVQSIGRQFYWPRHAEPSGKAS